MQSPFDTFLAQRRTDLRRIAGRTRGEYSFEELQSEAWIIASEIEVQRGFRFGFRDQDDQDTLFGWMHNRFVKYANKAVRYAVRLDRNWDAEENEQAGNALARLLTAPPNSDPQVRQQAHDSSNELLEVIRRSYTQAAAYVFLLIRVDWDWADLAGQLWVGEVTLRHRVKTAGLLARVQPSVFDGIASIDPEFEPRRKAKPAPRQIVLPLDSPQSQFMVFQRTWPEDTRRQCA